MATFSDNNEKYDHDNANRELSRDQVKKSEFYLYYWISRWMSKNKILRLKGLTQKICNKKCWFFNGLRFSKIYVACLLDVLRTAIQLWKIIWEKSSEKVWQTSHIHFRNLRFRDFRFFFEFFWVTCLYQLNFIFTLLARKQNSWGLRNLVLMTGHFLKLAVLQHNQQMFFQKSLKF